MTFTLKIECGNAAFDGDPAIEIARILRRAAERIEIGRTTGGLLDTNGNTVGSYALKGRRA